MAHLIITLPNGRVSRHELAGNPLVVGRDASCDVPIDDPSTSRQHARIYHTGEGHLVEDLDSKNGTLVNNAPCSSHLLRNGDQIEFGSVHAVYAEAETPSGQSVVIADDVTASHATRYVSREKQLALSRKRLQMIYELSEQLTTLQDRDRLLDDAMTICFETLHFERGAVGIRRSDGRGVDWPVVRNLYGAQGELTVSRTLLSRALERGERAMFTESDVANTDPTVSMVQHGIRSAMCVPLIHRDRVLGVVYGDRVHSSVTYSNEDIDFFAGIAQQISIGLINCQLVEEQKRMAQLEHDLELARTIQTGLLPASLPHRPGVGFAAINDPGQRVSGDYYDVIEAEDGRIWLLVADVTGEGMAAALLSANLQAAVRVMAGASTDPADLLARLNALVCHNTTSSKFITCLLALIDVSARSISVSSAGHPLPLIQRRGSSQVQPLAAETGFPLGVAADADYVTTRIDAGPEPFTLVCYTDGVTEAMNGLGEMFGTAALLTLLDEKHGMTPKGLVNQIRKGVAGFAGAARQSDDITILVAQID